MHRDDFQLVVISLLMANLAAVYLVGAALWREIQNRPVRVIRVYQGGLGQGGLGQGGLGQGGGNDQEPDEVPHGVAHI